MENQYPYYINTVINTLVNVNEICGYQNLCWVYMTLSMHGRGGKNKVLTLPLGLQSYDNVLILSC